MGDFYPGEDKCQRDPFKSLKGCLGEEGDVWFCGTPGSQGWGVGERQSQCFLHKVFKKAYSVQFKKIPCSKKTSTMELGHILR